MNPIELEALQKTRLNLLGNLDIDHVNDHLIQYKKTRLNLLENLDVDHVKDHLIQYEVINVDDKENIFAEPTRRRRVEHLLDKYLPRPRCQDAFARFCQALSETGYQFLRDNLVEEFEKLNADPTKGDWLKTLPPSLRKRRVSEQELVQIAQNLGTDWLLLGEELGHRKSRLQQIQMQNPYNVVAQIQCMFVDWRNSNASQATVENLVSAFRKCNIDERDYRSIIEESSRPESAQSLH